MGKKQSKQSQEAKQTNNLQEFSATPQHCQLCFDVLITKCKDQTIQDFSSIIQNYPQELLDYECPIFVTWHFTKNEELRGCIGTFASGLLKELLPRYTIISAFEDSRFSPISIKEIPQLSVEVSLLSNFIPCGDLEDWELGKHGLRMQFKDKCFIVLQLIWKQKKISIILGHFYQKSLLIGNGIKIRLLNSY